MNTTRRRCAAGSLLAAFSLVACIAPYSAPSGSVAEVGSPPLAGAGGAGSTGKAGAAGLAGAMGTAGGASTPYCKDLREYVPQFWDGHFRAAGVDGPPGLAPTVHDLASGPYWLHVVGDFGQGGPYAPARGQARWSSGKLLSGESFAGIEWPSRGFDAVAVSTKGTEAYAASWGEPSERGQIWIRSGDTVEVVGHYEGRLRRLTWVGDTLWAAGMFAMEDGGPKGLAMWDGTSWHGAPGGDPDHAVFDVMADADGSVLVSGEFLKIGGVDSPRIARWDGTSWSDELAMPAGQSTRVLTLARDGAGRLHAGGAFLAGSAGGLARWDGSAWQPVGGGVVHGDKAGVVSQLVPDGDGLLVSGCFDRAQGEDKTSSVTADGIARWDGAAWKSLDDGSKRVGSVWLDGETCGDEPSPSSVWRMRHQRMIKHAGALFVSGSFPGLGGVPSQGVLSYRDGAWTPAGEVGNGLAGALRQVKIEGPECTVFGLVAATHAGGLPISTPLLRYEGPPWGELVGHWVSAGPALPASVSCARLAVDPTGTTPWLICTDYQTDGIPHLYRLTDGAWQVVAPELPPVNDLAFSPEGILHLVGGTDKGFVARLDGDEVVPLGGEFDLAVLQLTFAPRTGGHDVLVTGPFTRIDGQEFRRVARWDGTTWNALGEGSETTPSAITTSGEAIYLAAHDEGKPGRKVLARWDGTTWTELADEAHGLSDPKPGTTRTFKALEPYNSGIVASSSTQPEDGSHEIFQVFPHGEFKPIGDLHATSLDGMAVANSGIWLAGQSITRAGYFPSIGVARLELLYLFD